jgi:4-amino-4-deoxy-L-arabinose transferase-like glycosyltransferase
LPANTRRWLFAILGLAVGVRALHFWAISDTAFLKFPLWFDQSDMYTFWQWAHRILAGDWLGRETYHSYFEAMREIAPIETWYGLWGSKEIFDKAPLYPYVLSILLGLSPSLHFVLLIQLLLGCLHPLIMFFLARRLFDDRAALVAAALTALYGPFVFHQEVLLRDWLPPLWEPLILLMVLRAVDLRQPGPWLAAGFVMGLATLTKETALLLVAAVAVWLVLHSPVRGRGSLRPLGFLCLGFALCFSPLIMRNVLVGAPALSVSVQGGATVFYGLAADSPGVGFARPPSAVQAIRAGQPMSMLGALHESVKTYGHDYAALAKRLFRKLRALADPFEVPNNVSYDYGRELSPILSLAPGYGLVFPLAAAGLAMLLREWPRHGLLWYYLLAALSWQLVAVVLARFRLALVPVLILAAAYALVRIRDLVKHQRAKAFGAACLVLSTALTQQWLVPLPDRDPLPAQMGYKVAAAIYATEKRFPEALAEIMRFRHRVEELPAGGPLAAHVARLEGDYHLLWGNDLIAQKMEEEARRRVQAAEQAYLRQPHLGSESYDLGLIYLKLRDRENAERVLTTYLEREPEGERATNVRRLLSLLAGE